MIKEEDTKSIFIIEEIGVNAEIDAAHAIRGHIAPTANAKLTIAMMAVQTAPAGKTMEHAGTFLAPEDGNAKAKPQIFADAEATVVAYAGLAGSSMTESLKRRSSLAQVSMY